MNDLPLLSGAMVIEGGMSFETPRKTKGFAERATRSVGSTLVFNYLMTGESLLFGKDTSSARFMRHEHSVGIQLSKQRSWRLRCQIFLD